MQPQAPTDSPRVYHGQRFDIHQVQVIGKAGPVIKDVVVHPGAVVVVPLLDDQTVLMIRNERVAVGARLWELPAGTLEPPEPADQCAHRELIEETGHRAGRVQKLLEFYSSPGICTELMRVFVARELTPVGQELENGEHITVEPVSLVQALRMIKSNEIRDAKTIAGLLYYHAFGIGD